MRSYPQLFVCFGLVLLSACGKQAGTEKAASASLVNAQNLLRAGELQAARTEIEIAIKADSRVSNAHLLAGQIAEKLGDPQTALNEYLAADATGAGASDGRHAAAALLLRAHAYRLAEEWIARCLADRPSDKTMKAYRALLEERLGDRRRARADAEAVLAENPHQVVANAVLAEEALRRKDPAEALNKIDEGLSTDASDKMLLQLKAEAFSQQKSPDKAIEIYQALVAGDPTAPQYRAALAELAAQSASIAQGEKVLRAGIDVAPGDVEMHMQLVSFLTRHGEKEAALNELLSAIKAAPDSSAYDIALADFYARDGEFEAATRVLKDAIARTRSDSVKAAKLALARLLMARDDVVAARAIVDDMLKASPTDDAVLAVRGQLLLKEQNPEAATRDFLSIAARQPANSTAYVLLADAYLQNDQPKEATAALKRALSLNPSNIGILRRMVDIQSGFGDAAEAYRAVDDFVGNNPDSRDGRALQIRFAIQNKDWVSAETVLPRLREIPESEQMAVELEAETREAQGQYADAARLYRQLLAWKENGTFDVAAAQAFARTSIAVGHASQATDTLTKYAPDVTRPEFVPYNLILATLFDSLGQVDKAQAVIDAAILKAPASPAPYLQQARAFSHRRDSQSALAVLGRGIAAGAPGEPLLLARAQVQNSDGQIDGAIATYHELLRANPKSAVGANELANMLADQVPIDTTALREARDLLQRNATVKNQAIIDTLAWADYRLGDPKAAKELLSRVKADQSSSPQLRFHYGAVLIALGEGAKGRNLIKTTLNDSYPGRSEAERLAKDETKAAADTVPRQHL
jgi:tetratricopeptide (TPR) repeat protein